MTNLDIRPSWRSIFNGLLDSPYRIGSLKQAVALCPLITEVDIIPCDRLMNAELLGLLELKELRKLEIFLDDHLENHITFEGGVRPLLVGLGSSLTSLKLSHLDAINIGVIVEHCPNLRLLSLEYNMSYLPSEILSRSNRIDCKEPVLKKLEQLTMFLLHPRDPNFVTIPTQDLLSLLLSPSLKKITIECCSSLTDNLLLDAANVHGFQKLECMTLDNCANISKRGIDFFMNESNPLSSILFKSMQGVSQQNVDEWKALAIRNNWQFKNGYSV